MDAHALSSQYELTAGDGRSIPQRPSVSFHGDFGAGLRSSDSDAGVRGDFATGTRSTSPLMPPGDFATGLRQIQPPSGFEVISGRANAPTVPTHQATTANRPLAPFPPSPDT